MAGRLTAMEIAYLRSLPKDRIKDPINAEEFASWKDSEHPAEIKARKTAAGQWLREPTKDGLRPINPNDAMLPAGSRFPLLLWDRDAVLIALERDRGSGNHTRGANRKGTSRKRHV